MEAFHPLRTSHSDEPHKTRFRRPLPDRRCGSRNNNDNNKGLLSPCITIITIIIIIIMTFLPHNDNASLSSHRSSGRAGDTSNHARDRAIMLSNENAELRQRLLETQERQEALEQERNFYRVKVSELTEVLQLKAKEDYSKLAVTKALQNAELSSKVERLKQELDRVTALNQKMANQREQNKHMLLELSGIVKALQSVPVDYERANASRADGAGGKVSLQNVKLKVETIMEDRRLLVLTCQELEAQNKEKDEKLVALEAQFHLLNSMRNCTTEGEDLTTIGRTGSNVSAASKTSITTAGSLQEQQQKQQMEIDMNVIRSLKLPSKQKDDTKSCATNSTASPTSASVSAAPLPLSSSPLEVSTKEERDKTAIQRLQAELAEANRRYLHFKEVCQTAFVKMKDVEAEFSQVKEECQQAKNASEEMRHHVKDVIDQYKELKQEYDNVLKKLEEAKYEIKYLQKTVHELEAEQEQFADALEKDGVSDNYVDHHKAAAYLKKARATIQSLQEKLAAAQQEADEAKKRVNSGGRQFRDAVAQCRKLKQEIKTLETRVNQAENDVQAAKKETQKYKQEAKQTRHRLTLMMKKDGTPIPPAYQSSASSEVSALMMPDLIMIPSTPVHEYRENGASGDQHRLLLLEAATAGKAMSQKYKLIQDRDRLMTENQELKAFCNEIMNDVQMSP